MSSLTGHLSLFATQSLKSIDKWMATANANLNGSLRVGFKESNLAYGGNTVNILKETSQTVNGIQIGEQALTVGSTKLDWSNGEVVSSTEDSHFAISGEGFFLVADKDGKIYYTRDGEFHDAGDGTLKNAQGLTYVDRALAINMGLYTSPAPTVDDINNGTGWYNKTGNWVPYIPGTKYDEAGSYQYMTVNAKKTVFVDKSTLTGTQYMDIQTDNSGYVIVNGHVMQPSDVISGPYPSDYATTTRFDITPYLVDGANTIIIQVTEITGGENNTLSSSNITGLDNTNWAVSTTNFTGGAVPTNAMTATPKKIDALLAMPQDIDRLAYSKYGATIFEDKDFPVTLANITAGRTKLDQPGNNGLGTVTGRALESSNVNFDSNIAQLAALGKMYNGFVQVIKVYNSALDEVLGFIR